MYEAPAITELGSVADFTREDSPNQTIDGVFSLGPIRTS
jgi:hypothetical protein